MRREDEPFHSIPQEKRVLDNQLKISLSLQGLPDNDLIVGDEIVSIYRDDVGIEP